MSGEPAGPPAPRASDADRDRAIEHLHAAVADGRLDPVEFDERLDAALAARTIDALTPLVTDLAVAPGDGGALAPPFAGAPAGPVPERLTIKERHGTVRRDGPWKLPHRLTVRTAWSDVLLDLTSAVRGSSELVIDLRMSGGTVELVLAPGMVVDANGLSVRHGVLSISKDPGDDAPRTLHVHLVGRMKHGHIDTYWRGPQN